MWLFLSHTHQYLPNDIHSIIKHTRDIIVVVVVVVVVVQAA